MKTKLQFHLLLMLSLLLPTLTSQVAQATPVASIAPVELLQFTSGGHALGFAADGMVAATGGHALQVSFVGANSVQPQAEASASDNVRVASLGSVVYADMWDGISLTYAANAGSIYRTTYNLAPGADPQNIRLRYNAPLTLNEDGTLRIAFETGAMTESAPIAWQEIRGKRFDVDVSFHVDGQEVSFVLGKYNPRHALVIDPSLIWNSFLGGSGADTGRAIAWDYTGAIYTTGWSTADWGDPERDYSGGYDAFVAKLDSTGAMVWNTFLGSSVDDRGYAIAANDDGLYVAGTSGGPTGGSGAWSCPIDCTVRDYSLNGDAFVARLDPENGALLWNTFLGSNGVDNGSGLAVDDGSQLFVVGDSYGTWGSPVRSWTNGTRDAFVAQLEMDGTLTWNTFLGGSGEDTGLAITMNDTSAFVVGSSSLAWSCSPVECTERDYTNSLSDAFGAKLTISSGALTGNTFLGGSGADYGTGIAVDATSLYVSGYSNADWGAPQRPYSSGYDAFAAKISLTNAILVWTTFLGQSGTDYGFSIDVDEAGNAYVVGTSDATWGSPQLSYTLARDVFVAVLKSSGALKANIFLGGSGDDYGYDILVPRWKDWVYVAGASEDSWGCMPTACTRRAFTPSSQDAFVAKVDLSYQLYLPLVLRN